MIKKIICLFSFLILTSAPSYADTITNLQKKVRLISHSRVDVDYHWISVQGGVKEADNTTTNTTCSGGLYFLAEDKEIAAIALTAQANSLEVNYTYDDNATPVNMGTQGTLSCRLLLLMINSY